MKKYLSLAIALALSGTIHISAQVLTGFGSSDINPVVAAINGQGNWATGTVSAHTFTVSGVSDNGGGIEQLFTPTPGAIPVTQTTNFLTLTGSLQAAPASGIDNFAITVYDSTLLDSLSYEFSWSEFGTNDMSFTGELVPSASVGVFNGNIGGWSLDPGGINGDTVSYTFDNLAYTATAIPEPSTYAMFGFGALLLYVVHRRRAARQS